MSRESNEKIGVLSQQAIIKIEELKQRTKENETATKNLREALGWYVDARNISEENESVLEDPKKDIKKHGYTFEELDAEFKDFNDQEIDAIQSGISIF